MKINLIQVQEIRTVLSNVENQITRFVKSGSKSNFEELTQQVEKAGDDFLK